MAWYIVYMLRLTSTKEKVQRPKSVQAHIRDHKKSKLPAFSYTTVFDWY
jgi:hypothetical protein